jgi:hypothetical protein
MSALITQTQLIVSHHSQPLQNPSENGSRVGPPHRSSHLDPNFNLYKYFKEAQPQTDVHLQTLLKL